jgi:hypothetical protein
MAVRIDATGDYLRRTANLPASGIGTICGWGRVTTAPASFCCLTSIEQTGIFAGVFMFMDSSGAISTYGSTPDSVSSDIATIGVGTPFFWALTNAGAGAGNTIGYVRAFNVNTLSSQTLGGTTLATPNQLNVGNDSFGDNFNGRMQNVKAWDRVLTASELLVESFYKRPMYPGSINFWWELHGSGDIADRSGNGRDATAGGTLTTEDSFVNLWVPRRKIFLPRASGGSSTDLVIQSATHAHTAESPTLTLDTTLAIQNATHAHVADNLSLTLDTTLAIDSTVHAHTADNLTLSVGTVTDLEIQSATHAHVADNLSLSLDTTLAIQDAVHAHTANNLSVSVDTTLSIDNALHAHAADNMTLSLAPNLEIQNAVHAHVADNLSLTLDYWLEIQDAYHAHFADNLILTGDFPVEETGLGGGAGYPMKPPPLKKRRMAFEDEPLPIPVPPISLAVEAELAPARSKSLPKPLPAPITVPTRPRLTPMAAALLDDD